MRLTPRLPPLPCAMLYDPPRFSPPPLLTRWICAWTQTRLILPSGLGVGEALEQVGSAGVWGGSCVCEALEQVEPCMWVGVCVGGVIEAVKQVGSAVVWQGGGVLRHWSGWGLERYVDERERRC